MQPTCIRAPGLINLVPGKRAWAYRSLNARRSGNTTSIDGRATWLIHNVLYHDEPEFDSIDRDWAIRAILGVGPDFRYEVISKEDRIGRRLVADRFRDRRVFICGDAAHLWTPTAGYGMNAGIADAANLSWLIAATLNGWAPPAILDAYEEERQPDVLRNAQEFFATVTGGRYERLISPLDSQVITALAPDGSSKATGQLSRGTEDQLYLALRFGLIREFGARSARLPVIVDDILVNFDPERAYRAAQAFVELAQTNQVLVFTCHPETRDLFTKADPRTQVIEL